MIHFPRQELDDLLGLAGPQVDPDQYDNFGSAEAPSLELCGDLGKVRRLGPCRVLAMHRSDDQSQAAPGHFDLEFEGPDGPVWVDLRAFIKTVIAPKQANYSHPLVLALCNPDLADLSLHLQALAPEHTVYWAHGEVTAYCPDPQATRILHAKQWFCLAPSLSSTQDHP